jgi:hypothetical protein
LIVFLSQFFNIFWSWLAYWLLNDIHIIILIFILFSTIVRIPDFSP